MALIMARYIIDKYYPVFDANPEEDCFIPEYKSQKRRATVTTKLKLSLKQRASVCEEVVDF